MLLLCIKITHNLNIFDFGFFKQCYVLHMECKIIERGDLLQFRLFNCSYQFSSTKYIWLSKLIPDLMVLLFTVIYLYFIQVSNMVCLSDKQTMSKKLHKNARQSKRDDKLKLICAKVSVLYSKFVRMFNNTQFSGLQE